MDDAQNGFFLVLSLGSAGNIDDLLPAKLSFSIISICDLKGSWMSLTRLVRKFMRAESAKLTFRTVPG